MFKQFKLNFLSIKYMFDKIRNYFSHGSKRIENLPIGAKFDAIISEEAYQKSPKKEIQGYKLIGSERDKVAYQNPTTGEIKIGIAGTNRVSDLIPDIAGFFGQVKRTDRYKSAKDFVERIEKQSNKKASLSGHSLGGHLVHELSKEGDRKASSFNPLLTPFAQTGENKNIETYISSNDPVSSFLGRFRNPETTHFFKTSLGDGVREHGIKTFAGNN